MQKALLDTTVAADLILGTEERVRCVEGKVASCECYTSKFVQLEFKIGPLEHLIEFYTFACSVSSFQEIFSKAVIFANAPDRFWQRRVGQLMLKVIGKFFSFNRQVPGRRGVMLRGNLDEILRDKFLAFMRVFVRNAWTNAFRNTEIVEPSRCFSGFELRPTWNEKRDQADNALPGDFWSTILQCLSEFMRKEASAFERVNRALKGLPADERDRETENRIKAIDALVLGCGQLTANYLRQIGDAFIAIECPDDYILLSSNRRHFAPMMKALDKKYEQL